MTRIALLGAVVLALVPVSVLAAEAKGNVKSGHDRMVALLDVFADRTAEENIYLGDGTMRKLRKSIASRGRDPAKDRIRFQIYLAKHHLRLGNSQEAIRQLSVAQSLLGRVRKEQREASEISLAYEHGMAFLRLGEVQAQLDRIEAALTQRGSKSA